MPSSVRTFLPVAGEPTSLAAAFEGDPQRWLPGGRPDGPYRYTSTVRAGSFSRAVTVNVGAPWRAGSTRWRSVVWDPIAEDGDPNTVDRLLPALDGELGLHLEPGGRVTLVLDARYHPPGGAIGAAADAVGLRRVARATVQRFLQETAARLAAEAMLHERPSADRHQQLDDGPTPVPS